MLGVSSCGIATLHHPLAHPSTFGIHSRCVSQSNNNNRAGPLVEEVEVN